jgi:phosphotransferase system HPr (HPr) family protein
VKETLVTMKVVDPLGIHARPASALAIAVKRSGARMRISAGGRSADATSVVQLLGLGAREGTPVTIAITGDDASTETARDALRELFG